MRIKIDHCRECPLRGKTEQHEDVPETFTVCALNESVETMEQDESGIPYNCPLIEHGELTFVPVE